MTILEMAPTTLAIFVADLCFRSKPPDDLVDGNSTPLIALFTLVVYNRLMVSAAWS